MTIGKAIELLKAIQNAGEYKGATDDFDAIKLGIEALKRRKRVSERTSTWADISLLGETK